MAQPAFAPSYSQDPNTHQYGYNGVSGDPSQAVGAAQGTYTTEQQAQDAWFKANPQYAQYNTGAGASGPNSSAHPAPQPDVANVDPPGQNPNQTLQPTYLNQLFPNGLPTTTTATVQGVPQINAQQIAGGGDVNAPQSQGGGNINLNPAQRAADIVAPQATYSGDVGASGVGAGSVTATNANASLLGQGASTSDIQQSIMKGLLPQFDQQNRALTEGLANAGIVGGSTTGAIGALGNQQQEQAMSQMSQYIMQGLQMQQQRDLANQGAQNTNSMFNANLDTSTATGNRDSALSASEANAANSLQASIANQNAKSRNSEFNAGLGFNAASQNQGAANDFSKFNSNLGFAAATGNADRGQQNAQFNAGNSFAALMANANRNQQTQQFNASNDLTAQGANQNAAMQGGQFNATSQNQNQQFDIANMIKAGMFDTSNSQQMQQFLAQLQQQDYLTKLGLQGNIIGQGQQGATNAFQPVFQQPSPVNYSGLAGAFGKGGSSGVGSGGFQPGDPVPGGSFGSS